MALAEILFLSRQDLMGLGISMPDVIATVEEAIRQLALGQVNQPEKIGLHYTPDRALHAMPAYIAPQQALGIKWVSSVPANTERGLPQTAGLVVLNDPETAFPVAVMDGTWITAMRTGAVSAVTARYLGPRRVEVLGLIGCGVQMRTQLLALNPTLRPRQVRAFDIRPAALEAFVSQMQELVDVPIAACGSAREAVDGADVVVSATWLLPPQNPPIKRDWLKPGSLMLPIDIDSVLEPEVYLTADKFVCDRWRAILDIHEHGWLPAGLPTLYAELAEVVGGQKPGRESDDERIVAMNTGMALEDVSMAKLAYTRAVQRGVGLRLPFISSRDELYQF